MTGFIFPASASSLRKIKSSTLASAPVKLKGKGTPMATSKVVDGDGLLDLVVHVSAEAFIINEFDQEAILEGQTYDGVPIIGVDAIRVIP